MNDNAGTRKPFNIDGSVHDCRNQKQAQGPQKVQSKPLTLEEIEARLKRLESIVIDPRK